MKYRRIMFTPSHFEGVQIPLGILIEHDDGSVESVQASRYPSYPFLKKEQELLMKALLYDLDTATSVKSLCFKSPHLWAEKAEPVPPDVLYYTEWVGMLLP